MNIIEMRILGSHCFVLFACKNSFASRRRFCRGLAQEESEEQMYIYPYLFARPFNVKIGFHFNVSFVRIATARPARVRLAIFA